MATDFTHTIATKLEAIAPLADAVSAWGGPAGLTCTELFHLNLVLEELVTNVIVHGLGGALDGVIGLRIVRRADLLEIVLRDDAAPFDPFTRPPPDLGAEIAVRPVGGLGVHLVRSLMDDWRYERNGRWNVVTLRKLLAGPA